MAKPFVRWVGGKQKMLPLLRRYVPAELGVYCEPFLGGGALFFDVAPERSLLSDTNIHLIDTWHTLKLNGQKVIVELRRLNEIYESLPMFKSSDGPREPKSRGDLQSKEDFYYWLRWQYRTNKTGSDAVLAARFIALMKLGFNGVYRVNASGVFNVPWGHQSKAQLCDERTLRDAIAVLTKGSHQIQSLDYEITMGQLGSGDFCYLDPPYDDSYTSYSSSGFGPEEQLRLAEVASDAVSRGAMVIATNRDTRLVRSVWRKSRLFKIHQILGRRSVSRDGSQRIGEKDVLIVSKNTKVKRT